MYLICTILLVLFCLLGAFDGLYFHLFKYKLHLHPSARKEHIIHTARAFVFVPMSLLLFVFNSEGIFLYAGIFLVLVDLGLELVDILEERKSRAPLGGISSEETAIHVFASSFKLAAITTLLLTKEAAAFTTMRAIETVPLPDYLRILGLLFAIGCLIGGIQSVMMMRELDKSGDAKKVVLRVFSNEPRSSPLGMASKS